MPSQARDRDPRDSSAERDQNRDRNRRRGGARDRDLDEVTEDESTEGDDHDDRGKERDRDHRDRDRDRGRDQARDRDRDAVRQRRPRDGYVPRGRDRDGAPPRPVSPPSRRRSLTERIRGTFSRNKGPNRDGPPSPVWRRGSSGAAAAAATTPHSGASKSNSPIPRIREWLDICNNQHGRHCSGESETGGGGLPPATFRPQFLIDVVEKRLVRARPDERYVALSYVFGPGSGPRQNGGQNGLPSSPPPAQLLKANLDEWLEALPEHGVPQTMADAIWLARKLGLRHIWIDRLCIVQDDEAVKEHHVRHMPYVFCNAYLTFVVAYGDVNTGIPPLNTRRSRAGIGGGSGAGGDHSELLASSRWNTRGWTLQELLYSRRAVFFFEDAYTWECHCDLWQSSGGGGGSFSRVLKGKKPGCANRVASSALAFQHAAWPDMDEYARIAADYSARRVTYVDDTLRAFAGITHVLSRVFPGGFMYGMPLMFLDSALLWRPQASIRRRALSRPPFLPSWSWMGWWFDGIRVDLTLWKAAAADCLEDARAPATTGKRGGATAAKRFQAPSSFRIRPTVVWRLSDRASSVPVPNTGLQFRELRSRRNASAALPPGWSRSGAHFVHDGDDDTVFKYPIPVEDQRRENGEHAPPPVGELTLPGPLLNFRTQSSILDADFSVTLSPKDTIIPPVAVGNIWGRGRRWIGEFRAHDGWLGIQSSNYDGDEKLEFIAISTVMERRGSLVFPPERYEENADEHGVLEVVNVLWIERIAGLAYRRGIGHIVQRAWEAQALNEVDIFLG